MGAVPHGLRPVGGDRSLDPLHSLGRLAHLQQQYPHHVQRIRVSRRDCQDLLINLARLGEATGAVQPLAVLQVDVDLAVLVAHWPWR